MDLVLATSNPGKAREARAVLEGVGLRLRVVPMWLGEVETGISYLENARLKALSVQRLTTAAVLAEDAGLEVPALNGLPGIWSARFAGPNASSDANNAKLLRLLDGGSERSARYRAVGVLLLPSGAEYVGSGLWEGTIATQPRGIGGFGYDPLFIPDGESRTAAEMSDDEKNAMSHRAQALREIVTRIGER